MHWIHEMVKYHPMLLGALGMGIANAIVTTMPSPDEKSSKGYVWLFSLLHALILAIPRIISQYKSGEAK